MKKAYSKPQIMFEDFTLSTSIAGDCEVKTNTPGARQCGIDYAGEVIFVSSMTGCTDHYDNGSGDGAWNGICYHVFYGDRNLFNS